MHTHPQREREGGREGGGREGERERERERVERHVVPVETLCVCVCVCVCVYFCLCRRGCCVWCEPRPPQAEDTVKEPVSGPLEARGCCSSAGVGGPAGVHSTHLHAPCVCYTHPPAPTPTRRPLDNLYQVFDMPSRVDEPVTS